MIRVHLGHGVQQGRIQATRTVKPDHLGPRVFRDSLQLHQGGLAPLPRRRDRADSILLLHRPLITRNQVGQRVSNLDRQLFGRSKQQADQVGSGSQSRTVAPPAEFPKPPRQLNRKPAFALLTESIHTHSKETKSTGTVVEKEERRERVYSNKPERSDDRGRGRSGTSNQARSPPRSRVTSRAPSQSRRSGSVAASGTTSLRRQKAIEGWTEETAKQRSMR